MNASTRKLKNIFYYFVGWALPTELHSIFAERRTMPALPIYSPQRRGDVEKKIYVCSNAGRALPDRIYSVDIP